MRVAEPMRQQRQLSLGSSSFFKGIFTRLIAASLGSTSSSEKMDMGAEFTASTLTA